ncbi:MAG: leucyl/phenylalanyl-tRNA--protein transferase [Alphaproteobacteria bacterium]|nr:leucyl/phenylalanyl-tRNA--protein transferase [Alphaproteobacteria bacterium]
MGSRSSLAAKDETPGAVPVTADLVLRAYAAGFFPMAESRLDPEVVWVDPKKRGVLPLDGFHVPRRLARTVRQDRFRVTVDQDFAGILKACASVEAGRADTWINEQIVRVYSELHERGYAHSVEAWAEGELAGGLYGVALGGAFFGESMFSFQRDASKVALVHLAARLKAGGFTLLDTQFFTEHLGQFGTIEIPRADYRARLAPAIETSADFFALPKEASGAAALAALKVA